MGWAAGFQAGSQVARNALDAYYGAKERREIEDLNQQAPEDLGYKLSPEQKQYIQGVQNAKDAEGNPQFQFIEKPEAGRVGLSISDPRGVYAAQLGQESYTPNATGGLSTGTASGRYTPIPGSELNVAPQQRLTYLGREYNASEFTPEAQRAARTQALAEIVSKYRPAEGVRLGLEAQKAAGEVEAREYGIRQRPMAERQVAATVESLEGRVRAEGRAETREVNLQNAETALGEAINTPDFDFKNWLSTQKLSPTDRIALQEKVNKFGLGQVAGAAIAADQKYIDFQDRVAAAEKAGIKIDKISLAREMGLSTAGKTKYFQEEYGVNDAELKANQKYLESKLAGVKNLEGLRELHKSDPNFDPGQHFDFTEGSDGKVTVRMFDTKTNEPLANVAPRVFKNRDDALASLVAEAKGADSLIAYTATKRKTDLEERWKEAEIKGTEAKTAFIDEQRKGLPDQARVWSEQANHLAAQTEVIPAESRAKVGLMKAQAANAKSGAALHDAQAEELGKVKASNLMPLTNATTGDVILVDVTKMNRNANGSLQIPNGYSPQKTLTDQQKSALEGYNKVLAGDTSLLEPANAAKREALITSLGLQGIIPVKGINPGANTDALGPRGVNAPASSGAPAAAPPPAYSNPNLSITARISAAYDRDNAVGNNYEVNRLREEAGKVVPQLQSQINVLEKAMMEAPTAGERESMRLKLVKLNNELNAYSGLLPQQGLR